jgi:hypothetical protein
MRRPKPLSHAETDHGYPALLNKIGPELHFREQLSEILSGYY